MCKNRIKSIAITVDSNKQAIFRSPERIIPIAILDTSNHTEVPCCQIIQRGTQAIPESDPRRFIFDHMKIVRDMTQHCIDFETISGDIKIQLPAHARTVTDEDPHPYYLLYIEQHAVTT